MLFRWPVRAVWEPIIMIHVDKRADSGRMSWCLSRDKWLHEATRRVFSVFWAFYKIQWSQDDTEAQTNLARIKLKASCCRDENDELAINGRGRGRCVRRTTKAQGSGPAPAHTINPQ